MASAPTISKPDADLAYAAAQKVVETHRRLSAFLRPGMTLPQIDQFVAKTLDELGCRSCFLKYQVPKSPPFPSHACLSVNHCVVHGTSTSHPHALKPGDVLKIDIGVFHRGWVGDAAWTYLFAPVAPAVEKLARVGKESLRRGIATLRPGNTYIAWAQAVQGHVERESKLHLIRGLGGHGYGKKLHAPPFVSNVVTNSPFEWPDAFTKCRPGTLVAVEPMLALGTGQVVQRRGEWPVYTADGSMSAHYEHDVLITEGEPRVLTEGLEDIKDVIE